MKSNLAASTLMSALLWSILLLSLFAAPALLAARSADGDADGHTAELIRRHQEAISPFSTPAPQTEERQVHSGACEQLREERSLTGKEAVNRAARPEDEPMIRQVGSRAKRIQV